MDAEAKPDEEQSEEKQMDGGGGGEKQVEVSTMAFSSLHNFHEFAFCCFFV